MNLGAPIGSQNTVPSDSREEGEHGAGIGLSGGHGQANARNTQSGAMAAEGDNYGSGFNAGVGGDHASSGIPHGHGGHHHNTESTPIADRFMGQQNEGVDSYSSGGKLDNDVDPYPSDERRGMSGRQGDGGAISGAYSGSGTDNGLTGQSGAQTTGDGVGYMGENISRGPGARTTINDGRVAGQQGEPLGTGLGALGGATMAGTGAQGYSSAQSGLGSADQYDRSGGQGYTSAASGLGAAGTTENYGSGEREDYDNKDSGAAGAGGNAGSGGRQGHYGKVSDDANRGQPLSNPGDIDSGGPHSLVFQESTGRYVHRRDL